MNDLNNNSSTLSKKILLIEDDKTSIQLMKTILEKLGFELKVVTCGNDVIMELQNRKPNLILMDIQLPDINGLEVVKIIRENEDFKMIPIIAVTAFAMMGDREKMLEGGCNDYISKPINIKEIKTLLEKYIHS